MKKRTGKLGCVLGVVAALAMTFAGCNGDPKPEEITVADPVITVADTAADADLGKVVTITSTTEEAELYYSLNGSDTMQYVYTKPFTIASKKEAQKVTVKAVATKVGWIKSKTVKVEVDVPALPKVEYVVTFDSDGGSAVEPVTVVEGEKVAQPTKPSKEGLNFAGWYLGETKYDFDKAVTANITLKAKWSADPVYTVTLMDGDTKLKDIEVTKEEEYKVTLTTEKEGYTLKAITSDKEGTKAVTFPLTVSADTTLYAQFEIKKFTVTVSVDGVDTPQTIEYGKKATKPADPTKEGYTFDGWFVGDTEYAWNEVKADVKVVAKFSKPAYSYTINEKINLAANQYTPGNYQAKLDTVISSDVVLAVGDKIDITITGCADKAITGLKVSVVDTTEAASYWTVLSDKKQFNVAAETDFSEKVTLTISKAPIGTGAASQTVVIEYDEATEPTTIWVSKAALDESKANPITAFELPSGAVEIANFSAMSEIPSNIALPGWGYAGSLEDDETYGKTLNLKCNTAGQYPTLAITFAEATDLSGKTIYAVMKGDSSTTTGNGVLKFLLYSDDDHASEENYMAPTSTTEYQTLSAGTAEGFWAAWQKEAADMTKITKLELAFQECDYDMQIAAIYYK